MKTRLTNYIKAAFPAVAVQTTEEQRACADIIAAAKETKRKVVTWSATEGMQMVFPDPKPLPETNFLADACKQRIEDCVFIMRDTHAWPFHQDPILLRSMRDFMAWAPTAGSCIMLIGPSFKADPTIEKMVTVVDYTLPKAEDLRKIAEGMAESVSKKLDKLTDDLDSVLRALGGLSTSEAENALALSLVESKKFCPEVIYREKVQAVRKSGLLEIIDADPRGLDSVGGLDILKDWIIKRKRAYSKEAEEYGLTPPKGIMLVGVPGTGKSLAAKAIGTALEVPTIKLDVGSLFNSLVGESESRTRDALKLAEAMSPCVLWVDEIDKGMAGAQGGGGDSGVTKRVFGTIISWMQERRRPVFLVATANQVQGLPPELLRKGRFDEIFAVDLPDAIDRKAIFEIHLAKRKRTGDFDLDTVVTETEGFTGSEIETVIDEAMFNAFFQDREVSPMDLLRAAKEIVPLSKTAKEQIESIREWASNRARFAQQKHRKQPSQPTGRRKLS